MLRLVRSPALHSERDDPDRPSERASAPLADPLGELAALCQAGDAEAQRTLLVTTGPSMLRVIRGVLGSSDPDVEDTLQESMVALHLALPGFRGECSTLHFACRIAVQTALNARRRAGYRKKHTPSSPPEELDAMPRDERSPVELLAAERRRVALRGLLMELPERQAEVLALHAVLGYTVEETAAVTAAPVNTVRSRLRHALSKLRARLDADGVLRETVKGAT